MFRLSYFLGIYVSLTGDIQKDGSSYRQQSGQILNNISSSQYESVTNREIEIRSSFLNIINSLVSGIYQVAKLDKPSDVIESNRWVWERTDLCDTQDPCTWPTAIFYFINFINSLYYKEHYFAELSIKHLYLGVCSWDHLIWL